MAKVANAGARGVTTIEEKPQDERTAGLTAAAASARLEADGPNELPRTGQRSMFRIAFEVLREPMLALLLAGGVAY